MHNSSKKVIKSILDKNKTESQLTIPEKNSENLLTKIISNCHSYESKYKSKIYKINILNLDLSPRDQIQIDEGSCVEDIKHRHYKNTSKATIANTKVSKMNPSLHFREMKKNFEYQMFADRQQIIHQDEISKEYKR